MARRSSPVFLLALCSGLLGSGLLAAAPALAQQRCRITDPTGTPLNVRTDPNGRIVGTVPNGQAVTVLDTAADGRGRPWVYVGAIATGEPIGWVFREFVSCF